MKSLFWSILSLLVVSNTVAQGIDFFEGTWQEALEKAKKEEKLLFVDAYAQWCGPCKLMAKNTFTEASVGHFHNKNFINLKLDMETSDGVTFGHKYPVQAYPTLFYLDGDGKVVKKAKGFQKADQLISLGEMVLRSNDQSGKYEALYLEGNREFDLVYKYIKALNAASKPSIKIANDYLNSQPQITEDQKRAFIFEAAIEADSRIFSLFIDNIDKLKKELGEQVVVDKALKACTKTVDKAIEFEMEPLLDEAVSKINKIAPSDLASDFEWRSKMKYFKATRQDQKYIQAYKKLLKIDKTNATLKFVVNDIAQSFGSNKSMIEDAENYAEKLYENDNSFENLNIYCSLLGQNNKYDKAIHIVEKLFNALPSDSRDRNQYEGLINYLKSKRA